VNATQPTAIQAIDLSRNFGALKAVDGINLTIPAGEIFGLVGPDGAGKTTTMRLLTSVIDPTSGSAAILGHDTVRAAEKIKEKIGYMSQRFGLYPDLTVLENIHFYADLYGEPRAGRAERIDALLDFSNLIPFKKRQARNLSGGMKQKLGLVCALIHTPQVLFLDEPTNGVDPVSRRDFWRILYRLVRDGLTIFLSTAYLDEAERCSRVGLMHQGRLLAVDTPEAIKRLMKGTLLELSCPESRRAMLLLREKLPQATVGLFGEHIHVVTAEPENTTQAIHSILQEAGLSHDEIRSVEPSLEDVFISVLEDREQSRDSK